MESGILYTAETYALVQLSESTPIGPVIIYFYLKTFLQLREPTRQKLSVISLMVSTLLMISKKPILCFYATAASHCA